MSVFTDNLVLYSKVSQFLTGLEHPLSMDGKRMLIPARSGITLCTISTPNGLLSNLRVSVMNLTLFSGSVGSSLEKVVDLDFSIMKTPSRPGGDMVDTCLRIPPVRKKEPRFSTLSHILTRIKTLSSVLIHQLPKVVKLSKKNT